MAERVLTLRELNRTLLARQLLLERENLAIESAVERLVGLQAQVTNPPYIGLWTRLPDFRRADLTRLMEQKQIVRATFLRSTIHLLTAQDYLLLWPTLQPALARALNAFFGPRAKGLDIEKLVEAAKAFIDEKPRTFTQLRALLSSIEPEREPEALAYAVRTHLPLVQVPPGGTWGYGGNITYATVEPWLGKPVASSQNLPTLILRYLAACGPATVMDVQKWSGLVRLKDAMEELKPQLRSFRDEQGNELFDLPDGLLFAADTPAPVRFVPEYDNLVLSHANRTRIIADEYRSKVFLSAARVRATFLVDGFVRGAWQIEKTASSATLIIEPFAPLSKEDCDALSEEGERLIRFVEDRAATFKVTFEEQF